MVVQVGLTKEDHEYWGRPEELDTDRSKLFIIDAEHPGADVCGQVAATFASGAQLFHEIDPDFATDLYKRSKEMRDFAWAHPSFAHESIADDGDGGYYPYTSYHYVDEIIYGSLWVAKAAQLFEPDKFDEFYTLSKQWEVLAQVVRSL